MTTGLTEVVVAALTEVVIAGLTEVTRVVGRAVETCNVDDVFGTTIDAEVDAIPLEGRATFPPAPFQTAGPGSV